MDMVENFHTDIFRAHWIPILYPNFISLHTLSAETNWVFSITFTELERKLYIFTNSYHLRVLKNFIYRGKLPS